MAKPNRELEPIENITWVDGNELQANNYNPNNVFTPELRLLELNILRLGWVQPVLVSRDMVIIDGFHRWMLTMNSEAMKARYKGFLPCAVLDVDRPTAMMLTVRMNRAKGSHIACKMSDLVKALVRDHGIATDRLAEELGATADEIELLLQDNVFKAKDVKSLSFSKAWYPVEVRAEKKNG